MEDDEATTTKTINKQGLCVYRYSFYFSAKIYILSLDYQRMLRILLPSEITLYILGHLFAARLYME